MIEAGHRAFRSVWLVTLLCVIWVVPSLAGAAGAPVGTAFRVFDKPEKANDFGITTTDGHNLNLSGLRGCAVLMGFWRKDCRYCGEEKQYLKRLVQTVNRPDLRAVMVNLWDNPDWVRRYARSFGSAFTFAVGAPGGKKVFNNVVNGRLMGYYILNEEGEAVYEVRGFPSTYVIDKAGRVVAFHEGMAQWSSPVVVKWIRSLLGPMEAQAQRTDTSIDPRALSPQRPALLDRLMSGPMGPEISN
ncbi:MAG: TlpA disulfide reductase family protein [Thermodesulfobacteriota bacterium]